MFLRALASVHVLLLAACNSSTAPDAVHAAATIFEGTVVATNGAGAIAGAQVELADATATPAPFASLVTDAQGRFRTEYPATSRRLRLTVSGSGLVTRVAYAVVGESRRHVDVTVGVFRLDDSFDLDFFRQIARGTWPGGAPQPLRPYTGPPMLGVVSADAGKPVNQALIDFVMGVVADAVTKLTGGKVVPTVTLRDPSTPTLRVSFFTSTSPGYCGFTFPGAAGGVEITMAQTGCGCGPYQIDPRIIRHLVGHALGLTDTPDRDGVMFYASEFNTTTFRTSPFACDAQPTARETAYGGYLYSRGVGNADPDTDSPDTLLNP